MNLCDEHNFYERRREARARQHLTINGETVKAPDVRFDTEAEILQLAILERYLDMFPSERRKRKATVLERLARTTERI